MPSSRNNIAEDLAKSLEAATTLMQDLLGDIKDNALSLADLKAKLESLTNNVETLSYIVRDGNGKGSMITRLALVEKSIEDMEDHYGEIKETLEKLSTKIEDMVKSEKEIEERKQEFRREKLIEKIKLIGLVAPGIIALAIVLFKFFAGMDLG